MNKICDASVDAAAHARIYIGRQLIIDSNQKLIGYELFYRHAGDATRAEFADDVVASAEILSNLLTHIGMGCLLGDNLAFVNVSPAMLKSDLLDLLPPSRIVLEVVGAKPSPWLLERCRELRRRGFGIAFDAVLPSAADAPLLKVADYIKLDVQALGLVGAGRAAEAYRCHAIKLIAAKVESAAEFLACRAFGFDGFQGFHFARPETLSTRAVNPAQARVIDLLNMIRTNKDLSEIEWAFKCDVALSIRLLRYINSVGFGLAQQVRSINHALTLLGYRQLYRWLSLLILAADGAAAPPALAKTALIRGRLTELLGQTLLDGQERDNLFIVGVFSLLDAILEVPMDRALEALRLPDNIAEALLHRRGIYGPYLDLTDACEGGDWRTIDGLCLRLGLSPSQVNEAQLRALAWAEDIPL